jgi:hypothetical protein
MKVLQTSPFPLGYRASEGQYSETSARFQPAPVFVLRGNSLLSDMVVNRSIQEILRIRSLHSSGKQDDGPTDVSPGMTMQTRSR